MVSDACNCVLGLCCHYWVWVWVVILKCWDRLFTSTCKDCCSCFYKYFVIGVASFVRCTVMQVRWKELHVFRGSSQHLTHSGDILRAGMRRRAIAELFYHTADTWKQKGGKKLDFSIPPDESDSVKVTGQDGATPSWTEVRGQWRKISLIWWKASLRLDSGWLAGSLYGTPALSPNGFSFYMFATLELLTHAGNKVLPLLRTQAWSHLWLHCRKWA